LISRLACHFAGDKKHDNFSVLIYADLKNANAIALFF